MNESSKTTCRIEALSALMDELCSPDLTLARGKQLRQQLADLLAPGGLACERPQAAPTLGDDLADQRWCAQSGTFTSTIA